MAEFAGLNIEGGVKLGYRDELTILSNKEERINFPRPYGRGIKFCSIKTRYPTVKVLALTPLRH